MGRRAGLMRETVGGFRQQFAHGGDYTRDGKREQAIGDVAAAAAVYVAGATGMDGRTDDTVRDLSRRPGYLAAGAEHGDHRCLHRRGHMHRRGIHADEHAGGANESAELGQRELA